MVKKIIDKTIGAHEDGDVIGLHSKKHHEKSIKCAGAQGRNGTGSVQGGYREGGDYRGTGRGTRRKIFQENKSVRFVRSNPWYSVIGKKRQAIRVVSLVFFVAIATCTR